MPKNKPMGANLTVPFTSSLYISLFLLNKKEKKERDRQIRGKTQPMGKSDKCMENKHQPTEVI